MDYPPDHPALLIIDCWYGWKDQDKKKTLQHFRDCTCQLFDAPRSRHSAHRSVCHVWAQMYVSAMRGSSCSLYQQLAQIWCSQQTAG